MAKYLTEVTGTFFLVLTIGLTALSGTVLAPLAIGAALMVMVYMGGHVSGGHYNPAVSVAVCMRGKLESRELLPYIVAQLIGAILAALAVYVIRGETFAPAPGAGVPVVSALLTEALYTFALCLVVLNVATSKSTAGNSYYGLAIGFTIVVGAIAGGAVSGGAYNPAVGNGPILVDTLVGGGSLSNLWLYIVGPVVGGMFAVAVFKMQEGTD